MRAFVFASGDFQTASAEFIPLPEGVVEATVPDNSDPSIFVWNGNALVDRASVSTWWVDPHGTRRAFKGDLSWAKFTGAWDDPVPLTLPQMRDALITAASSACDAVTAQVIPDATHQQAYDKAAMFVAASGGTAPSSDPFKAAFANLGASVGVRDADSFAKVVTAVSLASIELATILATLRAAAGSAKSASGLADALTTFEKSTEAFVTRMNKTELLAPVQAPAAIVIPGLTS